MRLSFLFLDEVSSYPDNKERKAIMIMGPFLLIIGVTVIVLSIAWVVSVVIPRSE